MHRLGSHKQQWAGECLLAPDSPEVRYLATRGLSEGHHGAEQGEQRYAVVACITGRFTGHRTVLGSRLMPEAHFAARSASG